MYWEDRVRSLMLSNEVKWYLKTKAKIRSIASGRGLVCFVSFCILVIVVTAKGIVFIGIDGREFIIELRKTGTLQ